MIPLPYRILALVLLALACAGFGYVQGLLRESGRRDAIALQQERADHKAFTDALANGKTHADNAIKWQRKAQTYYLNWQEQLNHEEDSNLAHCEPSPTGIPAAVLSSTWVGLYNSAWLPGLDAQGDPTGAAPEIPAADPATPREVLDNLGINAHRCAEDRKRHDELIDHLLETGATQTTDGRAPE